VAVFVASDAGQTDYIYAHTSGASVGSGTIGSARMVGGIYAPYPVGGYEHVLDQAIFVGALTQPQVAIVMGIEQIIGGGGL
jgi:hypothetical protein